MASAVGWLFSASFFFFSPLKVGWYNSMRLKRFSLSKWGPTTLMPQMFYNHSARPWPARMNSELLGTPRSG